MAGHILRGACPHCRGPVEQAANASGPNVCPNCYRLVSISVRRRVPAWIWAVLLVLIGNLLLTWM